VLSVAECNGVTVRNGRKVVGMVAVPSQSTTGYMLNKPTEEVGER
jgi:hypothetical protein